MAHKILLPTISDDRGSLTVIEQNIPFDIKRVFYIYNVSSKRGGHRHKKTKQALIAIHGNLEVYVNDGNEKTSFLLNSPNECLILDEKDWHSMDKFSKNAILLVLSSEKYDQNDYIYDAY